MNRGQDIVFMVCIDQSNHSSTYDVIHNMDYVRYCYLTWSWWCYHNNIKMVVLKDLPSAIKIMDPTWYRYHVFSILESSNIQYNRIALVDIDTMIRWNCTNFFNMTSNSFTAVHDDHLSWVMNSINGYKHMFPNIQLDPDTYFNCGFMIVDDTHRELFNKITDYYYSNQEYLTKLANKNPLLGADQTPVNYLIRRNDIPVNLISDTFNLTHPTLRPGGSKGQFINYSYIWHFNLHTGIRKSVMQTVWKNINHYYPNHIDIVDCYITYI